MAEKSTKRRRRIRRTLEQIRELCEDYEQCGQSAEVFAQQHDIGVSTLHAWRRRLGGKRVRMGRPQWVEVTETVSGARPSQAWEIRLANGICLLVPAPTAGAGLMELVRDLREL